MNEYKRGSVTDLNREESRKLRALWDARKKRMTQAEFGQTYGIGSQAAVGHFLNGHAAISLKAAKGFAMGLDCEISDFSERLANEAASLGQVSGSGTATDLMTLSRPEMHLIMIYRRLQPLHQRQLLDYATRTLKDFIFAPLEQKPTIDELIDWDEGMEDSPTPPKTTKLKNRRKVHEQT